MCPRPPEYTFPLAVFILPTHASQTFNFVTSERWLSPELLLEQIRTNVKLPKVWEAERHRPFGVYIGQRTVFVDGDDLWRYSVREVVSMVVIVRVLEMARGDVKNWIS